MTHSGEMVLLSTVNHIANLESNSITFFLFHRQKKLGRKIGLMVNLENWRLIN